MGLVTRPVTSKTSDQDGDLERLLQAEDRFDARLDAARQEAADRLRAARAHANDIRQKVEERLADEQSALRGRLTQEVADEVAQIKAEANRSLSRYADVTDDQIDELVAVIVSRVVTGGSAS